METKEQKKTNEERTEADIAIDLFKYQKDSFVILAKNLPCGMLILEGMLKGTLKQGFYEQARSIESLPEIKAVDQTFEQYIRDRNEDSYKALVDAVTKMFPAVQERLRKLSELQEALEADALYAGWNQAILMQKHLFKHFLYGIKAITPL